MRKPKSQTEKLLDRFENGKSITTTEAVRMGINSLHLAIHRLKKRGYAIERTTRVISRGINAGKRISEYQMKTSI